MKIELAIFLCAAFTSIFAIFILRPIAINIGLIDQPNAVRKHHSGAVPMIGGFAIFSTLVLLSIAFIPIERELAWLLITLFLTLILGFYDDHYNLNVPARFVGQISIGLVMTLGGGIMIESVGNLFGFGDIPLGPLAIPFTVLAIVGICNAFNMIDGIDGLAGSVALLAIIALLFLVGDTQSNMLMLILSGSLLGYLFFNLGFMGNQRKVFLGDAGSTLLGVFIVWLLIKHSQGTKANLSPSIALWIVALPLMDTVAVMLHRIRRGFSPTRPGRDHWHHLLMDTGKTQRQTLIIMLLFAVTLCGYALFHAKLNLPEPVAFYGFLSIFTAYFFNSRDRAVQLGHANN